RLLVRNILERLMANPNLRVDGPTSMETSVTRQGKLTTEHLLQYATERRPPKPGLMKENLAQSDVPRYRQLPRAPQPVYRAPVQTSIPFEYPAGRANLQVPEVRGHAMIVFE